MEKSYQDIVKEVKEKNPSMSHKDVQSTASEIYKTAVEAAKASGELTKTPVIPAASPAAVKQTNDQHLADAIDAAIRAKGVDQNNIMLVARAYDPNFVMVKDGMDGVNTKVHLEGTCRVPASGHYLVFL